MSQAAMSCPKCQGEMVRGFVCDATYVMSRWAEGDASRSLLGLKLPRTSDLIPIGTFRCKSCGFLESYARDEFAVK